VRVLPATLDKVDKYSANHVGKPDRNKSGMAGMVLASTQIAGAVTS
jgi:hypothetical protein